MEDNRLVKIAKTNPPKADLQNAGKITEPQRPKRHNRTKQALAYLYLHPY